MTYYLHNYNQSGNPYYAQVFTEYPGYPGTSEPPQDPLTVVDVDAYFTNSLNAAAWDALTPEVQAAAVAEAQRWLGTLCWKQEGCCGRDFEAAYLMAVSELALALAQEPTAVVGGANSGRWTKREKLDVLEVEYGLLSQADGVAAPGSKYPLIIQRFPWLKDILGCWLQIGPQREIRLFRN
jgi:hypothetical protein